MKHSFRTTLLYLIVFITSHTLTAQTLNNQFAPSDKMQFGVSFEKPFYALYTSSTISGVFQMQFDIPLNSNLNLIGDIPYIQNNYEFQYNSPYFSYSYKNDKGGLGNIYLGLQITPKKIDTKSLFTIGVYLPTADEEAAMTGVYTNYYDILKYTPNSMGFVFNYGYKAVTDNGFQYGFEGGPSLLIPTSDNRTEVELLLHYGITGGFRFDKLSLGVEYLGMAIISEASDSFSDRLIHSIDFGARWQEEKFSPNIFYRVYLKDPLKQMVDGVLGVGLSVSL